jgi:hypothetical protein
MRPCLSRGRAGPSLHLREAPGVDHDAVGALMGRIEMEMLANGASLSLCRFSDEPFNTNQIIFPRWSEIPLHPPTAGFAAAVFAAIAGMAWTVWPKRILRQPERAGA